MQPGMKGYQKATQPGFTVPTMLVTLFALGFFLLAFYIRLNVVNIARWEDLVFRVVMLLYFCWLGYHLVPGIAALISRQAFMIEAQARENSSTQRWFEPFMLLMAVGSSLLLVYALLDGSMADLSRRGSNIEFDSMNNPVEYWSSILAGYFIVLFTAIVYWQQRDYRLANR